MEKMNRTMVNFGSTTPDKAAIVNHTTPSNPGKRIRMATFSDETTPNPAALYYKRTSTTPTSIEESSARVSQSIHDRFSMSIRNIKNNSTTTGSGLRPVANRRRNLGNIKKHLKDIGASPPSPTGNFSP